MTLQTPTDPPRRTPGEARRPRRAPWVAVALAILVVPPALADGPATAAIEVHLPRVDPPGPWAYQVRLQTAEGTVVETCSSDDGEVCRFTVPPGAYSAVIRSPWGRNALHPVQADTALPALVTHRDPDAERGPLKVDIAGFRDEVFRALEAPVLRNQCPNHDCVWVRGLRAWDHRFGAHGYEGVTAWSTPSGGTISAISVTCSKKKSRCKGKGAKVQTARADLPREVWKALRERFSDRSSPGLAAPTVPGGRCDGRTDKVLLERSDPPITAFRTCGQVGEREVHALLDSLFQESGIRRRAGDGTSR